MYRGSAPAAPTAARSRLVARATTPVVAGVVVALVGAVLTVTGSVPLPLPAPSITGTGDEVSIATEDAQPPTARERPSELCRRSDRARSPCGPVLPAGRDTASKLVVAREEWVVIVDGDELTAFDLGPVLDPAAPRRRWRTTPFRGARAVSVADDGDLLIGAVTAGVAAIDLSDGTIRWVRAFSDDGTSAPNTSIVDVPVWLGDRGALARDPGGRLHAFDRDDGTSRWVEDVGTEAVVPTARGLLSIGREGLRLWHPDTPTPRWQRSGSDLRLHPAVSAPARSRPPSPVMGPLPLTSGRWLVDLEGGMVPLPSTGPLDVILAGELTTVVTWPGARRSDAASASGRATVRAFDADGSTRWRRDDLPLACCTIRSVPSDGAHVVLSADSHDVLPRPTLEESTAVVLAASNGEVVDILQREGATLKALTPTTEVWQPDRQLVGIDRRMGREAFRATGAITSVEPLLLEGPRSTVAILPDGPLAPVDVARPGPRMWPDPP
jgi:hypothetical protein